MCTCVGSGTALGSGAGAGKKGERLFKRQGVSPGDAANALTLGGGDGCVAP